MAQVIYSFAAFDDLDRLEEFLSDDPALAGEALSLVFDAISVLERHPAIGRPLESGLCELVISRGRSGYLALYRYEPHRDLVRVLRIRHQREGGYPPER